MKEQNIEEIISENHIFKDINKDNMSNGVCGIECEMAKDWIRSDSRLYEEFNEYGYTETSRIWEYNSLHRMDKETFERYYDKLKNINKEHFPKGSDGLISGGNHFNILTQGYNFIRLNGQILRYNLLNSLLFSKSDGKGNWYHRASNHGLFSGGVTIDSGRHGGIRVRDGLIEYRANNIIDYRVYGYYIGITLLGLLGLKLPSLSITNEQQFKNGIRGSVKPDSKGNISLDDIFKSESHRQYILYEKNNIPEDLPNFITYDTKQLAINLGIIINLLKINGLTNTTKWLKEYLDEFNIPYDINYVIVNGSKVVKINKGDKLYILGVCGIYNYSIDKSTLALKYIVKILKVLGKLSGFKAYFNLAFVNDILDNLKFYSIIIK